jgi:hypothetical protein
MLLNMKGEIRASKQRIETAQNIKQKYSNSDRENYIHILSFLFLNQWRRCFTGKMYIKKMLLRLTQPAFHTGTATVCLK